MPGLNPVTYEQRTLDNGLTVITHHDGTFPVAAVVVMYHAGSRNESPGRTGLAHLFEHLMFKGSEHVADGEHFRLLQEIGATVNGSTSEDRTDYYEVVPSNHLELALYLESDRMGFLPGALDQAKLDNQRDVVKNERRQNYDNVPYGTAHERIAREVFGPAHPYGWPVIGSMEDLSSATLEDAKTFFRTWYAPNNACLVIAGDFDESQALQWIEKYFGPLPPGVPPPRPPVPPPQLAESRHLVCEENVKLPRLFLTWPGAPRATREDALLDVLTTILSSGKNSRLYRPLVFERQIAQSVTAYADGKECAGTLVIDVTARPDRSLAEIGECVARATDLLLGASVTGREIESAVNGKEAQIAARLTTSLGIAHGLATAFTLTGDTADFNREFERFRQITPDEMLDAARRVFSGPSVSLSVLPLGRSSLAHRPGAAAPPAGPARGAESGRP